MKQNKGKTKYSILFASVFILFIAALLFTTSVKRTHAQLGDLNTIKVTDKVDATINEEGHKENAVLKEKGNLLKNIAHAWEKFWTQNLLDTKKLASKVFGAAIRTTLKAVAYDTATYLASGGEGQKPLFYREGFGTFINNVSDQAAGYFIENLSKQIGVNLCEPDLGVKAKIALGLIQYRRPDPPKCTFKQMKKDWDKELTQKNFLTKFQNMFEPASNDVGIALSLRTTMLGRIDDNVNANIKDRVEGEGWVDLRNIEGVRKTFPGEAAAELKLQNDLTVKGFALYTGDALVDAANVFLNQYLITRIKYMLRTLAEGRDNITSLYDNWDELLTEYESGPQSSGVLQAQSRFSDLTHPNFNIRGDYDALSELSICLDPNKAGPNNCVLTENMRQAIENQETVGNAIKKGYLDRKMIFGFNANGYEPPYNEGLPYRSITIMRKHRIVPVGWELAAQYIKDNGSLPEVGGTKTLEDMINCFSDVDSYDGFYESWCDGLVDPNWVFKVPLAYCARAGAGPEILYQNIVGKGEDSKIELSRYGDYCGDEQSCIRENDDGSCDIYGYCTEERRKWQFDGESCDPLYNTCQTFRDRDGRTISYLENTLEYGGCDQSNVGCNLYCHDLDWYGEPVNNFSWSQAGATESLPPAFVTEENAHDFYDYKDASFGNPSFQQLMKADRSVVFVQYSKETKRHSVIFFHDYADDLYNPNCDPDDPDAGTSCSPYQDDCDCDGGRVQISILGISPGNRIAQKDDPGSSEDSFSGSKGEGSELAAGDVMTWGWDEASTDGVAIEMPSGNWSIQVQPNFTSGGNYGIGEWVLVYDDGGDSLQYGEISLDDTQLLSLSHNEYTLNWTCAADPTAEAFRFNKNVEECDYDNEGCHHYLRVGDTLGEDEDVYLKTVPSYLSDECALDPAPESCDRFTDTCTASEVGCNLYTASEGGWSVPAIIDNNDYCPSECIGYKQYDELETFFAIGGVKYFIPDTGRRCTIDAVGCEEFTNLDKVGSSTAGEQMGQFGAEDREYFSYLRQCRLPDDSACSEFYTWEGSDESGYQLQIHYFEGGSEPSELGGGPVCDYAAYHLSPTDPAYNPDCYEFYGTDGTISYHNFSYTVECSDDCHPFRRTLVDQVGTCLNGGVWDSAQGACIYMAIPGQGTECGASEAYCREYDGPNGSNERVVFNNDFESGHTHGWVDSGGSPVEYTNESSIAGEHSILISGTAEKLVGQNVKEGADYILSFLAKGGGSVTASMVGSGGTASFSSAATDANYWQYFSIDLFSLDHAVDIDEKIVISGSAYLDNIKLTEITDRHYLIMDSWQTPLSCDNPMDNPGGTGCADSICSPQAQLNCEEYSDKDDQTLFLKSFSSLCGEDAVGCEMFTDTHNYSQPDARTWAFDPPVTVPADSPVYLVYDEDKECDADMKGCDRFGKPYYYEGTTLYQRQVSEKDELFLLNDPDRYDDILCDDSGVGCEEWKTSEGVSYFKDPGDEVCVYDQSDVIAASTSTAPRWDWWKARVQHCDLNGDSNTDASESDICLGDLDCPMTSATAVCGTDDDCRDPLADPAESYVCGADHICHYQCINDTVDTPCPTVLDSTTEYLKTVGVGGQGSFIDVPAVDDTGINWAGICPASESSCTEYIDPLSRGNPNILFNGNFKQDVDGVPGPDGWTGGSQVVETGMNQLYRFAGKNDISSTYSISCAFDTLRLIEDNNFELIPAGTAMNLDLAADQDGSIFFYSRQNKKDSCTAVVSNAGYNGTDYVELKKVVTDYQHEEEVNKTDCNGEIKFEDGCVLFNERTAGRNGYAPLTWDADLSIDDPEDNGEVPQQANGVSSDWDADSNSAVIKVRPDRVCNQWLSCKSFVKTADNETICYDVGTCDRMDDNGFCNSFVIKEQKNQVYSIAGIPASSNLDDLNAGEISNLTGYSKVGYFYGAGANPEMNSFGADLFPIGAMQQYGQPVLVNNGDFEINGVNKYPLGWEIPDPSILDTKAWSPDLFSVIDNPYEAQEEGIDYPIQGRGLMKYTAEEYLNSPRSDFINIEPDTDYIISAYVNTMSLSGVDNNVLSSARVDIYYYDGFNKLQSSATLLNSVNEGSDWVFVNKYFHSPAGAQKIKLHLLAEQAGTKCSRHEGNKLCIGNVYMDDLKIRPVLKTRDATYLDITDEMAFTHQTCRLYPRDDSLACQYVSDSGIVERGWSGYCLEYDRSPGNEDACLLWYPVDKVRGEAVEEGAGYYGRSPLYYCMALDLNFDFVEQRRAVSHYYAEASGFTFLGGIIDFLTLGLVLDPGESWEKNGERCKGQGCGYGRFCPSGYAYREVHHSDSGWFTKKETIEIGCDPYYDWPDGNGNDYSINGPIGCVSDDGPGEEGDCGRGRGFFIYDGDLQQLNGSGDLHEIGEVKSWDEGQTGVLIWNHSEGGKIYKIDDFAEKCYLMAQTVSNTGNNKAWMSRANEGSKYIVGKGDLDFEYNQVYAPYGALQLNFDDDDSTKYNPYEWLDPSIKGSPYSCQGDGSINQWGTAGTGPGDPNGELNNRCIWSGRCEKEDQFCTRTYRQYWAATGEGNDPPDALHEDTTAWWSNNDKWTPFNRPEISKYECGPTDTCLYQNYASSWTPEMARKRLMRLFAESQSVWAFRNNHYEQVTNFNISLSDPPPEVLPEVTWHVPTDICGATRPAENLDVDVGDDLCGILPQIQNITVDKDTVITNDFVNLTFNTILDPDQMPLVMYHIDWGDGEETVVTGAEMFDRPDPANPHSVYHLYSYWDMVMKDQNPDYSINCTSGNPGSCTAQPLVRVKDNWGFCNGSTTRLDCANWEPLGTVITVYER